MCHALIIEDDALIAGIIADFALMGGVTTFMIAASEHEALMAAMTTLPKLISSDVDLKGGGNGPAACAVIREKLGDIPVIFITGEPHRCGSFNYATSVLRKPTTAIHVIAAIRKAVPSL